MKKSRIIAPALGVLVLSTAASITGTVAWFTANSSVTVTGMNFTTQVSSNLLIASGTAGTGTAGEAAFTSSSAQAVTGILEPVSTVDGATFFYTVNAKADGSAELNGYGANVEYKAYDQTVFRADYGVNTAVGYIDYVYELKAVNTDTTQSKYITLSNLDLVYTGTAVDNQKAFRVAMFAQTVASSSNGVVTAYNALPASARCIIPVNGATNHTTDSAVSGVHAVTSYSAIKATAALTSLEVSAGSTAYYKITLRCWLEGEDTTCTNSTFLSLTDAWRLNAKLDLAAANTGSVANITKFAGKTLKLNTVDTVLYYDGTDLYRAVDRVKLNNSTKLPASLLTSAELDLLNTAFGSSYTLDE